MNNKDISYLMNLINNMDKNQISSGMNKLNQILTPDEKQKLLNILNTNNNQNNGK